MMMMMVMKIFTNYNYVNNDRNQSDNDAFSDDD